MIFHYWLNLAEQFLNKHSTTKQQIFVTGRWEGNKEYNMIRGDKV